MLMIKNMIKIGLGFILVLNVLMLSGCGGNGAFRDRINDYKTVSECQSLVIPRDVPAEARSNEYGIPERDGRSFRLNENEKLNCSVSNPQMKSKKNLAAQSHFKGDEKTGTGARGTVFYSSKLDPEFRSIVERQENQRKPLSAQEQVAARQAAKIAEDYAAQKYPKR